MFFHQENPDLHYVPHTDFSCEVTMLAGPRAVQDTWLSQRQPDLPVVSLDDIRNEMKVDPTDNQGRVVQAGSRTLPRIPASWHIVRFQRHEPAAAHTASLAGLICGLPGTDGNHMAGTVFRPLATAEQESPGRRTGEGHQKTAGKWNADMG